jgi:hypothetical protein
MKTERILSAAIALTTLIALPSMSEEATRLSASRSNTDLELSWPAAIQQTDGSLIRPYFELQRSVDLQRWQPVGERLRAVHRGLAQPEQVWFGPCRTKT